MNGVEPMPPNWRKYARHTTRDLWREWEQSHNRDALEIWFYRNEYRVEWEMRRHEAH